MFALTLRDENAARLLLEIIDFYRREQSFPEDGEFLAEVRELRDAVATAVKE